MSKITLGQLLQYYDMTIEPVEKIQVLTEGRDWDNADELLVNSALLEPFMDWNIRWLSCEESYEKKKPTIRVAIEPPKRKEGEAS